MTDLGMPVAAGAPEDITRRSPTQVELRGLATRLADVVPALAEAMAGHIHAHTPQLAAATDAAAVSATTASCAANLEEILSIIRAELPLRAIDTPPQALAYAEFLRGRGIGFDGVLGAYRLGVGMFAAVVGAEWDREVSDPAILAAGRESLISLLVTYITTILGRLANEFDASAPQPGPGGPLADLTRPDPASEAAAIAFRASQIREGRWLAESTEQTQVRARSRETLDLFVESVLDAAADPELSRRLALAGTSVAFVLADEEDLAATLLLDRTPVEVVPGYVGEPEITLWIGSFDLAQFVAGAFKLSMAIARGRVRTRGPVRKFLRVVPVLTAFSGRHAGPGLGAEGADPDAGAAGTDPGRPSRIEEFLLDAEAGAEDEDDRDETGYSSTQRGLLDDALEYRYHSGALAVPEEHPGDFWSVQCIDVF